VVAGDFIDRQPEFWIATDSETRQFFHVSGGGKERKRREEREEKKRRKGGKERRKGGKEERKKEREDMKIVSAAEWGDSFFKVQRSNFWEPGTLPRCQPEFVVAGDFIGRQPMNFIGRQPMRSKSGHSPRPQRNGRPDCGPAPRPTRHAGLLRTDVSSQSVRGEVDCDGGSSGGARIDRPEGPGFIA
jgi:hypothetical protein